jgi:uncharacterized protein YciI
MANLPAPLDEDRPALLQADRLSAAKQLARSDPAMVANVVKSWVGANE